MGRLSKLFGGGKRAVVDEAALVDAAQRNDVAAVTRLLDRGANLGSLGDGGFEALRCAIRNQSAPLVELLLRHGADPNHMAPARNRARGETPMYLATLQLSRGEAAALIVGLLAGAGAQLNTPDCDDNLPLHLTVKDGSLPLIERLIDCGAHVNARNSLGNTPLQVACHPATWQPTEIIDLLVRKGATVTPEDCRELLSLARRKSEQNHRHTFVARLEQLAAGSPSPAPSLEPASGRETPSQDVAAHPQFLTEPDREEARGWTVLQSLPRDRWIEQFPDFDVAYLRVAYPAGNSGDHAGASRAVLQAGLGAAGRKSWLLGRLAAWSAWSGQGIDAFRYAVSCLVVARHLEADSPGDIVGAAHLLIEVFGAAGEADLARRLRAMFPNFAESAEMLDRYTVVARDLRQPQHRPLIGNAVRLLSQRFAWPIPTRPVPSLPGASHPIASPPIASSQASSPAAPRTPPRTALTSRPNAQPEVDLEEPRSGEILDSVPPQDWIIRFPDFDIAYLRFASAPGNGQDQVSILFSGVKFSRRKSRLFGSLAAHYSKSGLPIDAFRFALKSLMAVRRIEAKSPDEIVCSASLLTAVFQPARYSATAEQLAKLVPSAMAMPLAPAVAAPSVDGQSTYEAVARELCRPLHRTTVANAARQLSQKFGWPVEPLPTAAAKVPTMPATPSSAEPATPCSPSTLRLHPRTPLNRIDAIKSLRGATALGLLEARKIVDACAAGQAVQVELRDDPQLARWLLELAALGFEVEVPEQIARRLHATALLTPRMATPALVTPEAPVAGLTEDQGATVRIELQLPAQAKIEKVAACRVLTRAFKMSLLEAKNTVEGCQAGKPANIVAKSDAQLLHCLGELRKLGFEAVTSDPEAAP